MEPGRAGPSAVPRAGDIGVAKTSPASWCSIEGLWCKSSGGRSDIIVTLFNIVVHTVHRPWQSGRRSPLRQFYEPRLIELVEHDGTLRGRRHACR
jgi:hypothetical protein